MLPETDPDNAYRSIDVRWLKREGLLSSGVSRRIAIIYGGANFPCRHCYQLAYPSQSEKLGNRSARRADRIHDKMGGPGGILEGGDWGKPKGMHWRTYERLCRKHDALSDRALVGIVDHLNCLKEGLYK